MQWLENYNHTTEPSPCVWCMYCNGDPINFVDPLGLEYIVVSGGRYSNHSNDWGYEFIEPAIKKLYEWKSLDDGENISWLVANVGWNDSDLKKFKEVADEIGVSLKMIDTTDDFVNYINKKNGNDRYNDKITKFVVFSHGKDTDGGTIELAYYHKNDSSLQISIDTIKNRLWKTAFDNPDTALYACNLATKGDISFAQNWVNKFGGRTWAFVNKSNYANINEGFNLAISLSRKMHGFSYRGSANYPVAGKNASFNKYIKK